MVSFERKISKDFKRLHKKGSGLIMSLSGKEKISLRSGKFVNASYTGTARILL